MQELNYLGINLVRDQAPNQYDLSTYQQLAAAGVKFDLITSPVGQDLSTTLSQDISGISALAQSNPGSVLSVEGPNELNGGQVVYLNGSASNNPSTGAAMVQDVSNAVRSDPTLSAQHVKVVNVSINNGGAGWENYVSGLGNLSAYVDEANWHVYFNNGDQPAAAIASMYQNAEQSAPGRPVIFTETGYFSAPQAVSGVDQMTQAKNTLNLLADAYKAGVQQTYLYELMNGVANPASNDVEDSFGLFNSDGSAKPVGTAIHNMVSVLSDNASNATTFSTGSLNYSISNLPGTGNSMLLEKANGAFELMVWNEAQDWNASSQSEINVSTTNAVVNLGSTYGTVKIFDPLQGASAIQTLNNVSQVTLGLTDHPLIIEVEPGSSAPPTPSATPSPDNTVVLAGSGKSIIDATGNAWTITSGGQVAVNGMTDTTTSGVIELAYEKGLVWQENTNKLWWSKTSPSDAWGPASGTSTSPVPTATPAPTPAPTPTPTASPDNTVVLASSGKSITDAAGNTWTITSGGQVAVNGTADTTTSGVIELAYEKGLVWQENANKLWWSKTSPSAAWGPASGTSTSPVPTATPTPSPADTVVLASSGKAITDAAGNAWTITSGGQVAVNGVADTTTSGVTELAYVKGLVWQENTNKLWWSKTSPSAAWGPAAGTSTAPISISVTPTGSTSAITIDATAAKTTTADGSTFTLTAPGAAKAVLGTTAVKVQFVGMTSVSLTGGSAAATIVADGGSNTFTGGKGALDVTGGTGVDQFIYHSGNGLMTLEDFSTSRGDTLTIDKSLQASMKSQSDGHGGTLLSFNGVSGIDLKGIASVPTQNIHWA